ncbi:MAG: cadherin-like beta sandwich domain-containing protein, partial [Akkermansiaceae bacterium]|nr:cadherin-like beta sandwich domain-containing protein [Akkermansiaceae bacterium]
MSSRIIVARARLSVAPFFLFLLCLLAAFARTATANPVTIGDASFDSRSLAVAGLTTTLTPWLETGGTSNGNGWFERVNGFAADGQNHLVMNLNHNVWQDLGVTYQDSTRYTLTVAVGNRDSTSTLATNQSRYLLAASDGTVFATGTLNASTVPVGTFIDAPALVFETGESSPASGKTIRILLQAGGGGRSHFDRVRLTALPTNPPIVTTDAASSLTQTGATLNGTVNPLGQTASVSFSYGPTSAYGSTVTATPATVSGSTASAVSADLTGLPADSTWHYRVVAETAGGQVVGEDQTFTTTSLATLKDLSLGSIPLSPAFAPATIRYSASVPSATSAIAVTPTTLHAGASATVNGVPVASGTASGPIALAEGPNLVSVAVLAADGVNRLTYTIEVTRGTVVAATFNSATTVPVTAANYQPTGTVNLALNFAPPTGTNLTVVNNTGTDLIQGTFDNLAQGQQVDLAFNGILYPFVANYYGGSGNDLVLEWANGRLLAWGYNSESVLGDGTYSPRSLPVPVVADGVLAGKTVTRVSLGERHALALCSDGTLAAWGNGSSGQLGNGSTAKSQVPVAVRQNGVLAGKTVIAISAGQTHSLVLCADGTLASWGSNTSSQLGDSSGSLGTSKTEPVLVDQSGVLAGKTVVAIAAGRWHNLVLCSDGTLASWGSNSSGALGNNSTTTSKVPVVVDRSGVLAGRTVVAISAGSGFNLVACSDGTVAAWGDNGSGQLGDGTTIDRLAPVLVDRSGVLAGRSVTAVDARGSNQFSLYHSVALCSDGSVVTWGFGSSGQLGNGSTNSSLVPLLAARTGALSGKTVITALCGGDSTHALCSDGSMAGWGGNSYGQLGNGSTNNSFAPVAVGGLGAGERFQTAAVGLGSVLARTALPPAALATTLSASGLQDTGAQLNGSVIAQGSTTAVSFEYGLTTRYGSTVPAGPASVSGTSATAVSANLSGLVAGTTYHYRVVATSAGGRVTGENQTFTTSDLAGLAALSLSNGSLAPAFTSARTNYVATVSNATSSVLVTPVVAQAGATVTVNGTTVVSGSASTAVNLAVGNTTISVVVTAAGGATTRSYGITVTRLPASFTFTSASSVPVTAADFSAGDLTANLALSFAPSVGTSLTLVNNTGFEPIRGTFANLAQAQQVNLVHSGISYRFVVDYFGGTGNDLVLRWVNTRLLAWGYNTDGQLGRGNLDVSNVPVAVDMTGVLFGKTVTAVAAGRKTSYALSADGRVAAWGNGEDGRLGINDYRARSVPVAVDNEGALFGRQVRLLTSKHAHVLALCTDGALVAWGDNTSGQASGNSGENLVPTALASLGVLADRPLVALTAGNNQSLALGADGTLGGWGGEESWNYSKVPVPLVSMGALAGKTITAVACGWWHSLALCSDGTLAAWGENTYGQLGDGSTTNRPAPVAVNRSGVLSGKTIIALAAGGEFSLVLCSDGTLASWGNGQFSQLGNGSTSQRTLPVLVSRTGVLSGKTVSRISAGDYHSLALCTDGTLAAWGMNGTFGALGNGSFTNSSVPVLVSTSALRSGERYLSVVAGGTHNLALVASPPVSIATTQAVTGMTDTGATLRGTVNANGSSTSVSFQYGLTTSYGSTVTAAPATLTGTTATAVSATLGDLVTGTTYHYRVVATSAGGTTYGENQTFTTSKSASLAGLSLNEGVLSPAFSPEVTTYAASVQNTAATVTVTPVAENTTSTITVNGVAVASGNASAPRNLTVGNNTLTVVVTPESAAFTKTYTVTVTRLPAVASFSSATTVPVTAAVFRASGHTIQLGLAFAPTVGTSLTVVRNTGSQPIEGVFDNLAQGQRVSLSFGGIDYPFVADYFGGTGNDLTLQWANRRLLAWGDNASGQLGDGTTTARQVPVAVDMNGVLAGKVPLRLDKGDSHALLVCSDGTLASWGSNNRGQLGSTTIPNNVPVLVSRSGVLAGSWPISIAAAYEHSLALCADGSLAGWGSNSSGQLGNDDVYQSTVPLAVNRIGALAGKTVTHISAGSYYSLALCSDGTLAAWGSNSSGQLGNGGTTQSNVPVPVNRSGVLNGKTVTAIACGSSHAVVLCSDGTLAAWGYGENGRLGNGSDFNSTSPVLVNRSGVLNGKTVTAIACGSSHTVVLCSDGTLAAWGGNSSSQLGNGSTTQSNLPVLVNRSGVLSGKTVVGLAAGSNHSLAWCSDGSMVGWGYNFNGQLGNNSTTSSSTPVLVNTSSLQAGERIIGAAAGANSSYAIVSVPPAPQVTTLAASAVADSVATLNASADAEGGSATVSFEYGLTTAYGSTVTATPSVLTGTTAATVSANLTGLIPGTTYHFRVVATSVGGTVKGADQIFTTSTLATLTGLATGEGMLSPAFDPRVTRYSLALASGTTSITVKPVAASAEATVTVNGTPVASGSSSQTLPLTTGNNTVTIAVNAGAGNILSYTLTVTRLPVSFAFASASSLPVTVESFAPEGLEIAIALNFAPQPGTRLTLVKNTGDHLVEGTFENLSQGQRIDLTFGGMTYEWVADYFGGDGNDLVLQWANQRILAWGTNTTGQLGDGTEAARATPSPTDPEALLAGAAIRSISAGAGFSVALLVDGRMAAWGINDVGQLGNGGKVNSNRPVWVDTEGVLEGKTVVKVVCGVRHALALCSDGTLVGWGLGVNGQLGYGGSNSSAVPLRVDQNGVLAGKRIIGLAAGANHSLVLCSDRSLVTWGIDVDNTGGSSSTVSLKPRLVEPGGYLDGKTLVEISAGSDFNSARSSDGTLFTWGRDNSGSLGYFVSFSLPIRSPRPLDATGPLSGRSAVALSSKFTSSLALCNDGRLVQWGGSPGSSGSVSLVNASGVLSGRNVEEIACAPSARLVRCGDNTLVHWQYASFNFGEPALVDLAALKPSERLGSIAAGDNHFLVLVNSPPAAQADTLAATDISDTRAVLRAAVRPNGTDTTIAFEYGPTPAYGQTVAATPGLASGTGETQVSAMIDGLISGTTYHFRVIATGNGGTVRGERLTFNTTDFASLAGLSMSHGTISPAFNSRVLNYHSVVPAGIESIILTPQAKEAASTVRVAGVPVASGSASAPQPLVVGNNPIETEVIAPGGGNTTIYRLTVTRLPSQVLLDGSGQPFLVVESLAPAGNPLSIALGYKPTTGTHFTIATVTGPSSIVGTFAGLKHGQTITLERDGVGYDFIVNYHGGDGNDLVLQWAHTRPISWGFNFYGQLGNGTTGTNSAVPVPVSRSGILAGKTVIAMTGGDDHSLALCSDGALASWGNGISARLGRGPVVSTSESSSLPVAVYQEGVLAGKTVVALAAGTGHSVVLCSDGSLAAWGSNFSGQLGDGTTFNATASPVAVNSSGVLAGRRVVGISVRRNLSLAVCDDGRVAAWGTNNGGQLGTGNTTASQVPVLVDHTGVLAGKRVVSAAAGDDFALALCDDGSLVAWGSNDEGQFGNGTISATPSLPVLVDRSGVLAGKTVVGIAAGDSHGLAWCSDGTLAAWGRNDGRLGDGTNVLRSSPVLVNRSGVLAGKTVVKMIAGMNDSVALCSDGTVAHWGTGFSSGMASNLPVALNLAAFAPGERVIEVGIGAAHGLAVVAMPPPPRQVETLAATSITDTTATLQGRASGNGSTAAVRFEYGTTPKLGKLVIPNPADISGTAVGGISSTLGGLSPGTTYHYRIVVENPYGSVAGETGTFTTTRLADLAGLSLNRGSLAPAFSPARSSYDVTLPADAVEIRITPTALDAAASVTVAGTPAAPDVVVPLSSATTTFPVTVTSADSLNTRVYQITVTRLPLTMNLTAVPQSVIRAGGFSIAGIPPALSLGTAPVSGLSLPVLENTGIGFIAGRFDNLAQGQTVYLAHGGIDYPYIVNYYGGSGNDLVFEWANTRLFAWGANSYGQLGDGTSTNRLLPTAVDAGGTLAGRTIIGGGCGEDHSVAVCADGSLFAWGRNQAGQLGTGNSASSLLPVAVQQTGALAGKRVTALGAGRFHTLALCDDGTVFGWGSNSGGELGDGSTTNRNVPVATSMTGALAGKRIVAFSTGGSHTLALCDDGTVAAWGGNSTGQLGNGTTVNSPLPVAVDQTGVLFGKQVIAVAAGHTSSYALCSDGTVASWGGNGGGQLGDGTKVSRSTPVWIRNDGVLAGKQVVALVAGIEHALVMCADGTLAAWGNNSAGSLGTGNTTNSDIPVLVNRSGVLAGKVVRSIHAASYRSFAMCDDGTLAAWGNNGSGALGNNSSDQSNTPIAASMANLLAGEKMTRPLTGAYTQSNLAIVTSPLGPRATTLAASNVGDNRAVLLGSVNPNGQSATLSFEYGPTTSYGFTVAASPASVEGTGTTPVSAALADLLPGTTYHFRVVTTGSFGVVRGENQTFTTSALATLAALGIDGATTEPAFQPLIASYRAVVSAATASLRVTPVAAHSDAVIEVNGSMVASGVPSAPIALAPGENEIVINVKAAGGASRMDYRVTVTRVKDSFVFRSAGDVGMRAPFFSGAGMNASFALQYAPAHGTNLRVIEQSGIRLIQAEFDNLPHGRAITLIHNGVSYRFVANYFGGDGNDLVLHWADTVLNAWGRNQEWQIGNASATNALLPVMVDGSGVLAGKAITAVASGYRHSLALCSDGTLAAWGQNSEGQLGDGTTTSRSRPVLVDQSGALAGKMVVAIAAADSHSLVLCAD